MDEKVKAVKKSAEAPQPPLKFAELTFLPSVGALGHAEFRSLRFDRCPGGRFFKADLFSFRFFEAACAGKHVR